MENTDISTKSKNILMANSSKIVHTLAKIHKGNSSFRNIPKNCEQASSQMRLLSLTVLNVDQIV